MSARFWIGTLFDWTPPTGLGSEVCVWLRGQQEICPTTGRPHHQVVAGFKRQVRLPFVIRTIGAGHWEPTKSAAADDYVWKDATSVPDTRFELGGKPLRRNVQADWDQVRKAAQTGQLDDVPADIYVRHYFALQRIAGDNAIPIGIEKTTNVYWGSTGTGKSRKAWEEAGMDAYVKDPRTKW